MTPSRHHVTIDVNDKSSLRSRLEEIELNLSKNKYIGITKKEKEKEVRELRKKLRENERSEPNGEFGKVIIGAIGLLSIPVIALVSGRELATLLYTIKLNRMKQKCKQELLEMKQRENGSLNPHWEAANLLTSQFEKASSKLVVHSTISLFSKVLMVTGGLSSFIGSQIKNNFVFLTGTVSMVVGLSAYCLERTMYSFIDAKEIKRNFKKASEISTDLLSIKEPYVISSSSPVNPQVN